MNPNNEQFYAAFQLNMAISKVTTDKMKTALMYVGQRGISAEERRGREKGEAKRARERRSRVTEKGEAK